MTRGSSPIRHFCIGKWYATLSHELASPLRGHRGERLERWGKMRALPLQARIPIRPLAAGQPLGLRRTLGPPGRAAWEAAVARGAAPQIRHSNMRAYF